MVFTNQVTYKMYAHAHSSILCSFLQCASGAYDFRANLSLLKLYQFHPHHFDAELAILLLLKSLMNLPSTDFLLLKCVLPQDYVSFYYLVKNICFVSKFYICDRYMVRLYTYSQNILRAEDKQISL